MATQAVAGRITWRQLGILLAGRLVFNTAFRIVYPLLPFLAVGLGVSLQTASLLVTVQVAATLLSPLGGRLADTRGERVTLAAGLALLTAGAALCAAAGGFWLFLAGYGLVGLGTALFMPAVQAYASNRSSYAERGRVLGFLELSWALAALVGVAGLTQLVEASGSWAPAFATIAAAAALTLALTLVLSDGHRRAPAPARLRVPALDAEGAAGPRRWRPIAAGQGSLLVALGFIAVQMFAVELIFVGYAGWLTADFGATTQQLGLVFGLLGFAELAGSVGATLLTDRMGKRRAVLLGFGATGLLMLLLPTTGGSWGLFLTAFLLFALCFEFAIVSVYPLVSGLGAGARGAVLALAVASSGMGRIVGSLVGPRLLEGPGFWANGLVAGAAALAGVTLGALLLREGSA